MRTLLLSTSFVLAAVTTATLLERPAEACGGCFVPQENPTVVTDHRMILSVSKDQSTLYDQIRYSGDPKSFAWVLPTSGEVTVGLSADVLFASLDQMTQTRVLAPPRNCPPRPSDCDSGDAKNAGSAAPQEPGGGVDVLKREVVGPYDTAQLRSTDPKALENWLATNGFVIPADVKPILEKYVTEKFDFLALKLVPGQGVQDMRPVRVTTKGSNAVLPLRMVAAGTGPVVGISLWVVSEGRYAPQNFPSFIVSAGDLVWDWNTNRSNYAEVRAQKTAATGGKGWEVESSQILYRQQVENSVKYGDYGVSDETVAQRDYLPVKDPNGTVLKTAVQVREEDLNTLYTGIPTATSRITRMRADLVHAALDVDLVVTADADQSVLAGTRQLTREANQPLCPVWTGCSSSSQAPRDEAIARSTSSGETFSCATTTGASPRWMAAGLGFAALAALHAVRRKRTR